MDNCNGSGGAVATVHGVDRGKGAGGGSLHQSSAKIKRARAKVNRARAKVNRARAKVNRAKAKVNRARAKVLKVVSTDCEGPRHSDSNEKMLLAKSKATWLHVSDSNEKRCFCQSPHYWGLRRSDPSREFSRCLSKLARWLHWLSNPPRTKYEIQQRQSLIKSV